MPETTSPAQPLPYCVHCGRPASHPGPGIAMPDLNFDCTPASNLIDGLLQPSQQAAGLECSDDCPAIPLLDLTVKLLAALHALLDDLPAGECPAAASFNLSNLQPPLSGQNDRK